MSCRSLLPLERLDHGAVVMEYRWLMGRDGVAKTGLIVKRMIGACRHSRRVISHIVIHTSVSRCVK